jgi:hypothetical protein
MSRVERVILDKWAGYVPLKPLEYALGLSYRSNDLPMHSQISAGKPIQVQDLIVKLRRADGQPGKINVRLKGRFDPAHMIEGWDESLADSNHPSIVQEEEPDSWPDVDDDTPKLLSAGPKTNPKSPGGGQDGPPEGPDSTPSPEAALKELEKKLEEARRDSI